jgi:hypothetical protein
MTIDSSAPRSRRALLAAAAGSVAAVAASAALPLGVAASPANLMSETDNLSSANTAIINNSSASGDGTAFTGSATGTSAGFGLEGTSITGAGVSGWSSAPPTSYWPEFVPADATYTGVFGTAPANPDPDFLASGVWGDSPDAGVIGSGGYGVYGIGGVGVVGSANTLPGSVGVQAYAQTTAQTALKVSGKVSFSRSGRTNIATGQSQLTINLGGVAANSRVFAVLASNRTGRYVRAVVPAANKFTIYLNTTVTSTTVVTWFVLDY